MLADEQAWPTGSVQDDACVYWINQKLEGDLNVSVMRAPKQLP